MNPKTGSLTSRHPQHASGKVNSGLSMLPCNRLELSATLPLLLVPICETLKCILLVLKTRQSLLSFYDNKTKIYT